MNDDFSQEKVDVRSRIELEIKATYVRELAMEMIAAAGSGHPGGSLSIADVITAIYFGEINGVPILNIDPKNPRAASRDRVVLSKGHAAPILYAALNLKGFFSEEHNSTLRELNSPLQGHPDMNKLAGIDMSSGELGLGLSTAGGIAHASRILEKPYAVYAILGDGEMQKGQVWEALMAIPNKRLNNICLIVDRNKLQIDGTVEEVNDIGRVEDKLKEFGWNPMGIDGHSFHEILKAINTFKNIQEGQPPVAIVAHTRKGAGVVAMSGDYTYHGKAPRPKVLNNAKEAFELKREDSRKRLAKLTKHEDEPARIQKPLEIKNGHDNIESLESIIKRKPVRDYVRSTATRRAFGYALHRLGSYEPIVVLNADLIESTKTFDFVGVFIGQ